MKAVILAGGRGTRLQEETSVIPKPLVKIGDEPILMHIIRNYAVQGVLDFIICGGYKWREIVDYFTGRSDFSVSIDELDHEEFCWGKVKVTVVDTGEDSMTGERLRRIRGMLDGTFFLTYGDGVSNVDVAALLRSHTASFGALVTVTAVHPPSRFGVLAIDNRTGYVTSFSEKPDDKGWINGGFFVMEPEFIDDFITKGNVSLEEPNGPLDRLAYVTSRFNAYLHEGFWYAMDTVRDRDVLRELWDKGRAPWRVW